MALGTCYLALSRSLLVSLRWLLTVRPLGQILDSVRLRASMQQLVQDRTAAVRGSTRRLNERMANKIHQTREMKSALQQQLREVQVRRPAVYHYFNTNGCVSCLAVGSHAAGSCNVHSALGV